MSKELLLVTFFGAAGALTRYGATVLGNRLTPNAQFPYMTLCVNVLGCILIGSLMTLVEKQIPEYRSVLFGGVIGFLGSFTTFSAFSYETFTLVRTGHWGSAALYVGLTLSTGLGGTWLGRALLLEEGQT